MSLNRRNLFRAAGALAGAGLIPAGEALAAPQKAAAKAAPAPEAGCCFAFPFLFVSFLQICFIRILLYLII